MVPIGSLYDQNRVVLAWYVYNTTQQYFEIHALAITTG